MNAPRYLLDTFRGLVSTAPEKQITFDHVAKGLTITELNDGNVDTLADSANVALNGRGTCDPDDLEWSCFACEYCRNGVAPTMTLQAMLSSAYRFVAVCDEHWDRTTPRLTFVGCITANTPSAQICRTFSNLCEDCIVISNFCVAKDFRSKGVGKMLLETIMDKVEHKKRMFLLVAKNTSPSRTDLVQVFDKRVPKLLSYYAEFDFKPVEEGHDAHLLRYVAVPSSTSRQRTCSNTRPKRLRRV